MAGLRDVLRRASRRFQQFELREGAERGRYASVHDTEEAEEIEVDLSLLRGPSQDFDDSTEDLPQDGATRRKADRTSYLFPQDPNQPSWQPFVVRRPLVAATAIMYVSLGAFQEVYFQAARKLNDGGHIGMSPVQYYLFGRLALPYLTLLMAMVWQICDIEVKRLEPYHQLAKRQGASASDSLGLRYLMDLGLSVPAKAFHKRHWRVLITSLASIIATYVVVVLQAGALSAQLNEEGTGVTVSVHPVLSRMATTCLLVVGCCGIMLIVFTRQKTGLLGDPAGIATMAAMATTSHVLSDFQDLDTASDYQIDSKLNERRYNLHRGTLWQGTFSARSDMRQAGSIQRAGPCSSIQPGTALLAYVSYVILVAGITVPFVLIARKRLEEQLESKYVPIVLMALTLGVKAGWSTLDIRLRIMQPFFALSRRNASPETLTLDYTSMLPGRLTYQAFRNGHRTTAFVSIGSLLTNILIICMMCLDVDPEIYASLYVDTGGNPLREGSMQIPLMYSFLLLLSLVMFTYLAATAAVVYWLHRETYMPRQPGSIASVLAYVHQSKMLHDFVDAERMSSKELSRRLHSKGKSYGFGWFIGRDGETHCGIDEEPLISNYKHGTDYSMSRAATESIGSWDHF